MERAAVYARNRVREPLKALAAAFVLSSIGLCSFTARADDVVYSNIGWWQIAYRKVDNLTGCHAVAHFKDRTVLQLALIQSDA